MKSERPDRVIRISLFWQFLLQILVASVIPILLISSFVHQGFTAAAREAGAAAQRELDAQATTYLQVRATHTAHAITQLLVAQVRETRAATALPHLPAAYLDFYRSHQGELWYPAGTRAAPQERRVTVPLYREIAYIDAQGREQIRIVDGHVVPPAALRDVRDPAHTTYRTETYFAATRVLPRGEVYVSHVTAWYTSEAAQPGGALASGQAVEGARYGTYDAILRFATPVVNAAGAFDGIVMLALDYRQVMEEVIHLQPDASPTQWTVYPDYSSGDYAYLFDDEGYVIAHPRLARIRGLDPTGQLVPYMTGAMSREEREKHPLNVQYAAFVDPNLPTIYAAVRRGQAGSIVLRNTAGVHSATAYMAIPFTHGVYRASGIFGGIAVATNLTEFYGPATSVQRSIRAQEARFWGVLLWGGAVSSLTALALALLVTRLISHPLLQLTAAARLMERGELDSALLNRLMHRRVGDELTKLAQVFTHMAEQVQLRERKLKEQLVELHIQIDEQKKQEQVAEITESEYFQDLKQRARTLRTKKERAGEAPDQNAGASTE